MERELCSIFYGLWARHVHYQTLITITKAVFIKYRRPQDIARRQKPSGQVAVTKGFGPQEA